MRNLNILYSEKIFSILKVLLIVVMIFNFASCEDNNLPEVGSITDVTPPSASFSATQGEGSGDEWKNYRFSNKSNSATMFLWDFGNGNTSTDFEPTTTYSGEGTYTITLTVEDNLGVIDTHSETIEVVKPAAPQTPDPILVNTDFNKIAKLGGSDCTCSGWNNDDIGEQGESSSGNGSDVIKFDNNEPDHAYQEFEVVPNADYTIVMVGSFKPIDTPPGSFPGSMLEVRVLAGSGYNTGYTPTYYTTAPEYPKSGYGYTTVGQVEDAANNLTVEAISNPGNTDYNTYTYTFNAGNNNSVALFVRGIGGASGGSYDYNNGDEEIRLDSVTITAN